MIQWIANLGRGFSPAAGGGEGEAPDDPVITAIAEADGVVTLTVTADALVSIYTRTAGTSAWTLAKSSQAAGDIDIESLTAGATHEFYAVAVSEGLTSAPSNVVYLYLHDSDLPTVSEIELAAAGVLNEIGVFKTSTRWKHQLSAAAGGLTNLDKFAPCVFVGEQPTMNVAREGGYTLDRKISLVLLVAQQGMADDGTARTGSASLVGTQELRTLIIAALDGWHPGAGFDCDEFHFKGAEEVIDINKQHGVHMVFEANWLTE